MSFAGSNLFILIPDSSLGCILPTRSSYHSDQTLWCWLHAPTNMQFVFFLSFKKIDTQNLWSIKPVKYGPQFFPWRPLIDRVVMYLRSGMTACLCWHTDSQTVWCTCWSHFVVTQEGDDNGWPSCWMWLSLMMMCLHNQWTIWPVAMAGKWSMKAPSNKPHL